MVNMVFPRHGGGGRAQAVAKKAAPEQPAPQQPTDLSAERPGFAPALGDY